MWVSLLSGIAFCVCYLKRVWSEGGERKILNEGIKYMDGVISVGPDVEKI